MNAETKTKIHVGDVAVCVGEPPGGNPYLGSLIGNPRKMALAGIKLGILEGFTLWFAPAAGGARRITKDEVDWETSGV